MLPNASFHFIAISVQLKWKPRSFWQPTRKEQSSSGVMSSGFTLSAHPPRQWERRRMRCVCCLCVCSHSRGACIRAVRPALSPGSPTLLHTHGIRFIKWCTTAAINRSIMRWACVHIIILFVARLWSAGVCVCLHRYQAGCTHRTEKQTRCKCVCCHSRSLWL